MSIAPYVELGFNPTDLRPRDLPTTGAFLGSPADALEAALAVTRAAMVDQMRTELRGIAEPTHAQIVRLSDLAWQAVFWKFRKVSAPVMADAYLRAYAKADAGDVPVSVIYDLADKHAEKIGDYFHASSRDALAEGFTTLVNRRVPAKAAADRVLDAYGLTKRQMRGYVSAQQQFNTPIADVLPRSLKAKAREYIDKAFTSRTRKLSRQEEHNIDEQAKQFAWMWLQDKGRLAEQAQKMWITAHDERVCPVCGPLHGQKVGVNEQFKTKEGNFWTPGLHPNCRCVVRLIENRFTKRLSGIFAKADFDPRMHPRGGDPENRGRFSTARLRPVLTEDNEVEPEVEAEIEEATQVIMTEPVQRPLGSAQSKLGTRSQVQSQLGSAVAAAVQTPLGTPVQAPLGTQVQTPLGTGLQMPLGVSTKTRVPSKTKKLDTPHFGVVDNEADFQLAGQKFFNSRLAAEIESARLRNERVDREFKLRCGPNGSIPIQVQTWDEDTSQILTAQVSPTDFLMALRAFAYEAHDDTDWQEMSANNDFTQVVWTGAGVQRRGTISNARMIHEKGIEPSDFVNTMLVVEDVYDDEDLTRQVDRGTVELSGNYIASGGWTRSTIVDAGGKPIVAIGIEPYE